MQGTAPEDQRTSRGAERQSRDVRRSAGRLLGVGSGLASRPVWTRRQGGGGLEPRASGYPIMCSAMYSTQSRNSTPYFFKNLTTFA